MLEDPSILPMGMLSAPQIHYCVQKYNIIEDFCEDNLQAAVYEMRLGSPAVRWEDKKKIIFELSNKKLSVREALRTKILHYGSNCCEHTNVLELPPNSLTFITTIERFNLPRDIIARFNLKSKWVHRGLLLGTGPIVDPGFQSKVLIPLHNFSSLPVCIDFNAAIINVEFTKILNPDQEDIGGYVLKRVKNRHSNVPIEQFLEAAKNSESSVYNAINSNKAMLNKIKLRLKMFTLIGIASFIAVAIASLQLVQSTNAIFNATQEKILSTHKDIIDISVKIKHENVILRLEQERLKEELNLLKNRLVVPEEYSAPLLPNAEPPQNK